MAADLRPPPPPQAMGPLDVLPGPAHSPLARPPRAPALPWRVGRRRTVAGPARRSSDRQRRLPARPVLAVAAGPGAAIAGEVEAVEEDAEAPLLAALRAAARAPTAPFHFPGHKQGQSAPRRLAAALGLGALKHDLPELPGLGALAGGAGPVADAQALAARCFGADATWFLVNGSTCGIQARLICAIASTQAAVLATCNPGDTLVLPRNAHQSAFSAMVLSGAYPRYISPDYDEAWGIAHGVAPAAVAEALERARLKGEAVGAVLVVSPTYFGVCSDLGAIAEVCHDHDVPLVVDEAHGAHFLFHSELPSPALEQQADVVVQSTHKVMSSLTQSAMLHARGCRVNRARLSRSLALLQSSSPSFILLASLDAARAQMAGLDGLNVRDSPLLSAAINLARWTRRSLAELPGIVVLDEDTVGHAIVGLDVLRITVSTVGLGLSGVAVDEILCSTYNVIAELPSLHCISFAFSSGTTAAHARQLVDAFAALSKRHGMSVQDGRASHFPRPTSADAACTCGPMLSPRVAFFSPFRGVPVQRSVGQISAELMCPYPPGIPVILPGEVITAEAVAYLQEVMKAGGWVNGPRDDTLEVIDIIDYHI
eukprot:SM000049S16772  [mRNA]  locus=s49:721518:725627:+ [translate_table: standard]